MSDIAPNEVKEVEVYALDFDGCIGVPFPILKDLLSDKIIGLFSDYENNRYYIYKFCEYLGVKIPKEGLEIEKELQNILTKKCKEIAVQLEENKNTVDFHYGINEVGSLFAKVAVIMNIELLCNIAARKEQNPNLEILFACASKRQSVRTSLRGHEQNTNGHPDVILKEFAKFTGCDYLELYLENLLKREERLSISERLNAVKNGKELSFDEENGHLDDNTKIFILYNIMHYMATNYKSATTTVHFLDDSPEILQGLEEFFSEHLIAIPKQITLKLAQHVFGFDPKSVGLENWQPKKDVAEFAGTGIVEENFSKIIRELIQSSEEFMKKLKEMYNNPEKFANEKAPDLELTKAHIKKFLGLISPVVSTQRSMVWGMS